MGFSALMEYFNRTGLSVRVTRGVARLCKPDGMDSEEFQRHAEFLLPHLKANKRGFAGQYDGEGAMNGVQSFKDLPPARKREMLFERLVLRAAACAGRVATFSWYTRLMGWVSATATEFERDVTKAFVCGPPATGNWSDAPMIGKPVDLPAHTFPVEFQGTKPGVWHVPPRVALHPPDGCILPADYQTPAFVKAAEKKARFERYRSGWKAELSYKDSMPPD